MNCGNCNLEINQFEVYIEYDDSFYHEKCFCCNYCFCSFSYDENTTKEKTQIPLKDKNNKLFCINDLIRTLKCSACCLNFEPNSQIFKLKNATNDDKLVHVDCVKCNLCKAKINISNEYILEDNTSTDSISLICKCCCTSKRSELNKTRRKNRLSSRQKEILRSKFIQSDSLKKDLLLTEESLFVSNLAKEIGCSKNAIIDFITKRRDEIVSQETNRIAPTLNKIIDELKNIDRDLAPNQSPFTQGVHKSLLLKV